MIIAILASASIICGLHEDPILVERAAAEYVYCYEAREEPPEEPSPYCRDERGEIVRCEQLRSAAE